MAFVIDPITRVEGHWKVEIDTTTKDVKIAGTMFRGFEKILEGRNPRDASVITQRICGV